MLHQFVELGVGSALVVLLREELLLGMGVHDL